MNFSHPFLYGNWEPVLNGFSDSVSGRRSSLDNARAEFSQCAIQSSAKDRRLPHQIVRNHGEDHFRLRQSNKAVLGRARVIPDRIVHAKPNESEVEQIEVDVLNQLPLGPVAIGGLDQACPRQTPWWDRGVTSFGIKHGEFVMHCFENIIHHHSKLTQQVSRRPPGFLDQVVENREFGNGGVTHGLRRWIIRIAKTIPIRCDGQLLFQRSVRATHFAGCEIKQFKYTC
jgi:hypothetical protein